MTTQNIKELKGSFVQAIVLTPDNLKEFTEIESLPGDMIQQIKQAVVHPEEFVLYAKVDSTNYCYFPAAGRGGVCSNGLTDWTDCTGLDDLEYRWKTYETNWVN